MYNLFVYAADIRESMVEIDQICNHKWRAINGTGGEYGEWEILEQCEKCGKYQQRTLRLRKDNAKQDGIRQ